MVNIVKTVNPLYQWFEYHLLLFTKIEYTKVIPKFFIIHSLLCNLQVDIHMKIKK